MTKDIPKTVTLKIHDRPPVVAKLDGEGNLAATPQPSRLPTDQHPKRLAWLREHIPQFAEAEAAWKRAYGITTPDKSEDTK